MNVLPFQAHSATSLPPAPHFWLTTFPDAQGLSVIPGECGPRALAGCLMGMPHRGLEQGRGRKRALLAKSELLWGAPSGLGTSRGP